MVESTIVRVNVGCGNDIKKGYVNCDLTNPMAQIKCGIVDIDHHFKRNSVDEVYAKYIFEHLTYRDINLALFHISKILKNDGKLIVVVPNFKKLIEYMDEDVANCDIWFEQFFGDDYDTYHRSVWTEKTGRWLLTRDRQFKIIDEEQKMENLIYTCEKDLLPSVQ